MIARLGAGRAGWPVMGPARELRQSLGPSPSGLRGATAQLPRRAGILAGQRYFPRRANRTNLPLAPHRAGVLGSRNEFLEPAGAPVVERVPHAGRRLPSPSPIPRRRRAVQGADATADARRTHGCVSARCVSWNHADPDICDGRHRSRQLQRRQPHARLIDFDPAHRAVGLGDDHRRGSRRSRWSKASPSATSSPSPRSRAGSRRASAVR